MLGERGNGWLVMMVLGLWSVIPVISTCTQEGPCKCRSEQGLIDLSAIQGDPPFKDILDSHRTWLFSYSPCRPFSEGFRQCDNVAVCQLSPDMTMQYPAGTVDSATWDTDSSGHTTITYTQTDGTGVTRTTVVTLKCEEDNKRNKLLVIGQGLSSDPIYTMTLVSPHCCPQADSRDSDVQLSVGTIICIAVLGVVSVYLAGGALVQKRLMKASGKETIPNYNFWSALASLIRDGTAFTFRCCCRRREGYEKV